MDKDKEGSFPPRAVDLSEPVSDNEGSQGRFDIEISSKNPTRALKNVASIEPPNLQPPPIPPLLLSKPPKRRRGSVFLSIVALLLVCVSAGLFVYNLRLNSSLHSLSVTLQHGYMTQTAIVQHQKNAVQIDAATQTALAQKLQNVQGTLTAQATGTAQAFVVGTPGATFITQSNNQVTVHVGASFTLFFTVQNTGTSIWSDQDGYTLSCTASSQRAFSSCLGGGGTQNQLHFGSYLVTPGHTFTFMIRCTADPAYLTKGAGNQYYTFWQLMHKGTPFGTEMEILVTVTK